MAVHTTQPLPEAFRGRAALTVAEFAEAMGCSRATVYNLVAAGQLRAVKVRNARRIPIDELRRVASEGTR